MSLVSPLLALIYRGRSRGVHLRVQVNFPNPSLLHTAGLRTFLVSRGPLCRCHLVGQGCIFMGFLPSWTPGRLIRRSRGVTPSSVAPECLGDSKSRAGTRVHPCVICMRNTTAGRWQSSCHEKTSSEGMLS